MSSNSVKKLQDLLKKCKKNKIDIRELPAIKDREDLIVSLKKWNVTMGLIIVFVVFVYNSNLFLSEDCTVTMPDELTKALRQPENCDFCRDVNKVIRVESISPDEFERDFAYQAKPVIITDATKNWTALETFDFWYFKDLYENVNKGKKKWNCQFFPYKTEFKSLYEALAIPDDRVNYEPGAKPWYFGWSNCNRDVAEVLRQHYGRPYFLPRTSENNAVDWIFMGGPGLGAHMHVDNVRLPSWQAQVRGTKEWTLAPPPECYYECEAFKAVVLTGDVSKYTLYLGMGISVGCVSIFNLFLIFQSFLILTDGTT